MPSRRIPLAAAAGDRPPPPPPSRLLLATAHPDDEALFFVPALLSVGRARSPLGGLTAVDVVCLSTGNAAGLGAARTKELHAALPALLGSRAGEVTVLDHPGLQDGVRTAWDVAAATEVITSTLHARPATAALLSFDAGGVTGHPNHAATAAATARVATTAAAHAIPVYRLLSLPWYLAWLGPAALVVLPAWSCRCRRRQRQQTTIILTAPAGPAAVLRGLATHASQRTWWRVLGALARSASYVSVLEEV